MALLSWLRIGGQQRQSHGLSLFPYYPTNSTLLPNWIVASISTMKIGQMTLQGSFHIHVSVNVYCKGERHGGHMSASSAILLMKYYDDNNTYLNFRCNIWAPADGTAVALLDQLILHSSNNSWSITKLALEYSVVDVEDRDRGKYQHSNNDSICTYDVTYK